MSVCALDGAAIANSHLFTSSFYLVLIKQGLSNRNARVPKGPWRFLPGVPDGV
jgi:hypothetical protein